jgi:Na+-driven multidrug efflux pump
MSWPMPCRCSSIAALFQLFDSAQAVGAGLLRGLKDTRVPMLLAIVSYWVVGFPLAYILGFVFDGAASACGADWRSDSLLPRAMNTRFLLLRPTA